MRTIDLNADLGELGDGSLDDAVMPYISSANIACGAHAGTPESMRRTVRLAKEHGVAVGAHPGYPDVENFGRISMDLSIDELCTVVADQILQLKSIAGEEGASVYHVKLHGALYNDLAFDYERSLAVSKVIASIDPSLRFIVFSGSETARAAEDAGLVAVHEVFADRAYMKDGRLRPRSEPGAVLYDEDECLNQAGRFVDGESGLLADSICVHGDNPSAIVFVSRLRDFFLNQNITVRVSGRLEFNFFRLGVRSLLAKLPSRISRSAHRKIRALQIALEGVEGITELLPCYAELKVDFNSEIISFGKLQRYIEALTLDPGAGSVSRLVEVPVCYNGTDLGRVADHNGISEKEVIRRHSEVKYLVYMLGFSPGFPYMGGLDPDLATPRLENPRISVPAGSVGIAGQQTGIYPVESPGGWNIIGHSPLSLFDASSENPFLFEPGDEVRFVSEPMVERLNGEKVKGDGVRLPGAQLQPGPINGFVKIIEPGMYTTVQDGGRVGFLRYGLTRSGAMDQRSFEMANSLLGNDLNVAVLECTGTMPIFECSEVTRISAVYVDRSIVLEVSAEERVCLDPIRSGYRAYIAFEGGIDVPVVMDSRSTYVQGKLGGFEGRVLRSGDVFKAGQASRLSVCVEHRSAVYRQDVCPALRVVPGPESDWFDCGGLNTFLTEAFTVSSKSDRTGIRLEGKSLSVRSDAQMVSAGIAMGTIQVPSSGLPIVMMADHPTAGGYPRIGNVIEEDLPVLAQLRPGDAVRFIEVRS